jgi:hypothetical protein
VAARQDSTTANGYFHQQQKSQQISRLFPEDCDAVIDLITFGKCTPSNFATLIDA